jgi:secreted PhoX family phosphatase
LPIYSEKKNYLATSIGQGTILNPTANANLLEYTVIDDVVVPPQYERYVIAGWGDRVFPRADDYVGYNNDYTGFVPDRIGKGGALWINHEYVSFPFSHLSPAAPANLAGQRTSFAEVIGFDLPTTVNPEFLGEICYNIGGSALQVKRGLLGGRFSVIAGHNRNFRLHGLSGLAINATRADGYAAVTSWGTRPHQQGDDKYLVGTGPAAHDVFETVNADGLGNRIIGTGFNCSGATTPWGTIMSGEENFQGSSLFFLGVQEDVKPNGTQTIYLAGTTGAAFGQLGEKYGWLVEIDPNDPKARQKKHTALGRFRHENVALRVKQKRPLIAYMGDDRRGGHTWKFVSNGLIKDSDSKLNSKLLEDGTLYVAKYNADGTGEWIPLALDTPTNPVVPSEIASVEIDALGSAQRNGNVRLPRRNGIAGQTLDGGAFVVTTLNEDSALPDYRNKTLADFYASQGAVLCDAFLAANLVGGTPTSRPEDVELHPQTNEVFIAMTDGAPGSDGYPDSRIFAVAKLAADDNAIQPVGALYKIVENSKDGTGTTFKWERFLQGAKPVRATTSASCSGPASPRSTTWRSIARAICGV